MSMRKRILTILAVILAFSATFFCVACNKENNPDDTKESYTLVIHNDFAKGSVVVNPVREKYESGTVIGISVSVNEGWVLDGVIINGKNAEVENGRTEFTIGKNTTVDVVYKNADPEATYTLTVENDGEKGEVSVSPSAKSYKSGTKVTVKVDSIGDNVLESITVNGVTILPDANNSVEITITQNTSVIVNYKETGEEPKPPVPSDEKYTLTINNDEEKGTVSVSPVQDEYEKNAKVTITVTAKEGYEIESVIVNGLLSSAKDGTATIVITSDTSVRVVYKEKTEVENGTKENPYLISTAEELFEFSANINSPDSVSDKNYSAAYFRLANDIDMDGMRYNSAGKKPETLEDGTLGLSATFRGTFDGAGHTIKNLSISRTIRNDIYYVGLFGYTYMADIRDLTLENVCYEIESFSDKVTVGASVGGVVGFAHLTNLTNVSVSGTIVTRVGASNTMYIGGLAGAYNVSDEAQAYIAYVRHCNSSVKTEVGEYDDGDKSSLDSGINGGIIGYLNISNGAAAVVNCSSTGAVAGGKYLGGIVAYISGSNVSVINCLNYSSVRASTSGVSYAGGILGFATGNVALADCYSKGAIVATKSGDSIYKSYAGGVLGFANEDDYDGYYKAGAAVINCYYSSAVRTFDVKNEAGVKVEADTVNAAWLSDTVRININEWKETEDGKYAPKAFAFDSGSYTLSYYKEGKLYGTEKKDYTASGYSIIGVQTNLSNEEGKVFFDWAHEGGVRYRFYIPVVKDMRLDAVFGDVSELSGVYSGKGEFHGERDGGILVINEDGTCSWTVSNKDSGTFTTDGTHIIFDFNTAGLLVGSIENGEIKFAVDYGMSGEVPYTFAKTDISVFGDYYSENGEMITFTDKNVTFQSAKVNKGKTLSGSFVMEGDDITIKWNAWASTFFAASAVKINPDYSLTVSFEGINGTTSLNEVIFSKRGTPDYSDKKFVGRYYLVKSYASGGESTTSSYIYEFFADGNVSYWSTFGVEHKGNYMLFGNNDIKLNMEGNISDFTFDEKEGIIRGLEIGGLTNDYYVIFTPQSAGQPKNFLINNEVNHYLLVTDEKVYYVHGAYDATATVSAENKFEEGDRVTINGNEYRSVYYRGVDAKEEVYIKGYGLTYIGKEEGSYTNGSDSVILDGIGNVTGTKKGTYKLYENNFTVIIFEDDTILGFDYKKAQTDGNVITPKTPDKYQGVWYMGKTVRVENEKGEEVEVFVERYNKIILDGFNHVAYLYTSNYDDAYKSDFKPVYRFNWDWGPYSEDGVGVYCVFNDNNQAGVVFYYDMNLLYFKLIRGGKIEGYEKFIKDGYTGTTDIPILPAEASGSYNGEENGTAVVFNLKSDLSGTYKGMPFMAVYDGKTGVAFKIGELNYLFDIGAKTLSYGDVTVSLTRSGEVTEIIPEMFAGTWEGVWQGFGTSGTDKRKLKIETNGTLTYNDSAVFTNAVYDNTEGKITAKTTFNGEPWEIVLVWNASANSFSAKISYKYDADENWYSLECSSLTKNA